MTTYTCIEIKKRQENECRDGHSRFARRRSVKDEEGLFGELAWNV